MPKRSTITPTKCIQHVAEAVAQAVTPPKAVLMSTEQAGRIRQLAQQHAQHSIKLDGNGGLTMFGAPVYARPLHAGLPEVV